jgi:hypothetical protein
LVGWGRIKKICHFSALILFLLPLAPPPQAKANKSLMDHRSSTIVRINRLRLEESDYNSIDTPRVEERRHQHQHQHQPLQQQFSCTRSTPASTSLLIHRNKKKEEKTMSMKHSSTITVIVCHDGSKHEVRMMRKKDY